MIEDQTIYMRGMQWWTEKRDPDKPRPFALSLGSVALGFLLAASLSFAVPLFMQPKFPIHLSPASASAGVMAGEVLPVVHGVSGECGPDGGWIIAEARPLGSGEWRTIKEIKMRPINLEPGGALSTWRIPGTFKPGGYQAQMTIWCYGARGPLYSQFRFSVLGALRG